MGVVVALKCQRGAWVSVPLLGVLALACSGAGDVNGPTPSVTGDGSAPPASPPGGGVMPGTGRGTGGDAGVDNRDSGNAPLDVAGDAPSPVVDNDEIFDPERLPRFDLELPQASIDALNLLTGAMDPRQDNYVRATFRYGDVTLKDVGVRIKGEASFRKLDRKAPFKIKFDEFVNGQAFRGLKRLTLNNMVEDPSFLAERLAYHFFRAAKLPAPRCNHALVYVNGAFYGVYANVEAEDKPFLRRWFPSDEGNLYEEGQRDFVPGAETAFDLETNDAVNDRTDLKNLIAALQAAAPATFLADLGASLDTAHYLRFTAAEAAVNQWDMYSYTVFYPNNFRIYHNPATAKFVFLPWGMDMSMKPFRDSGKPHIKLFEPARQGDRANGRVTGGLMFQGCLDSPGCRTAYAAAATEIAQEYEKAGLEAVATRAYDQIKAQVLADPRKEYSAQAFETGYQSLLRTIRGRPAAMRADLQAEQ